MNLQEFSKEFDTHFFVFVKAKIKKYKSLAKDQEIEDFISHVEMYLQGGKRLRPYGIYLALSDSRKKIKETDWMVMIAVELIHALALIHDDIIDKSLTRRDVFSVNGFIEKKQTVVRGNKHHYANSQAILVGDLLYAAAFEILFKAKPNEKIYSLVQELLDEVIVGQMIDVKLAASEQASKQLILRKAKYKTALYTFSRPFQIGALLGKLPDQKQQDLFRIGEKLGILFQIQDDYLDVFGDEKILKKEGMNDIREGQQTLLTDHFFNNANEEQKKVFLKFFGRDFPLSQTIVIQNLLREVGSEEYLIKEMSSSFKKIRKSIDTSNFSQQTKDSLNDIVSRLEARR
jgi:geranylgeranyl diphosphate synthase type I